MNWRLGNDGVALILVEATEEDPEYFGDLPAKMDQTSIDAPGHQTSLGRDSPSTRTSTHPARGCRSRTAGIGR